MDGRRTCLVVGFVVAGLVAGGAVADALPGNGNGGPSGDSGNHFGQLKHEPTQTETTPPTTPPPPPSGPAVTPPAPPTDTTATSETAPSSNAPPAPAPEKGPAPARPVVIPGPLNKSLALPNLPRPGALPPVPKGYRDATSELVITSAGGPRVLRLIVPEAPTTGQPVNFTIAAAGARPVGGVTFDFDEPAARFGELACRSVGSAQLSTFAVPFTFSASGPHTVHLQVSSGSCGASAQTTKGEIAIDVAKGGATVRAAADPATGALVRTCANADALPTTSNGAKVRRATLCLLNKIRAVVGLRALKDRRSLRRIATAHARDMVTRHYFDHSAPPTPASSFYQRLHTIRWKGLSGENIGFGSAYYATPRAIAWAWMHSAAHRANILTPAYRWVGIAVAIGAPTGSVPAAATYTTDFGGR